MSDSAWVWRIVENAEIILINYVEHFWVLSRVRDTETWLTYAYNIPWITQFFFLTGTIKQS